jgi:hypothetical protein
MVKEKGGNLAGFGVYRSIEGKGIKTGKRLQLQTRHNFYVHRLEK